jgi:hypothetical protein
MEEGKVLRENHSFPLRSSSAATGNIALWDRGGKDGEGGRNVGKTWLLPFTLPVLTEP